MKKVQSADGTSIAYETIGQGPPLILIGGAFCDRHARAAGTPLAALLAGRFTAISYDRRGRGDSGDTPPYAIEREVEDLAALIAAVGGRASLFGMSSGALLALEAAVRGLAVDALALYEPPMILDAGRRPAPGMAAELDALAAAGRRGDAAELFLTRAVGVPAPAVAGMKQAPMWRGLEALADTLGHDVRITAAAPALLDRLAEVRAPVVVIDGSASPPWLRDGARAIAEAAPAGRHHTIEGQTHDVDPARLAAALQELLV